MRNLFHVTEANLFTTQLKNMHHLKCTLKLHFISLQSNKSSLNEDSELSWVLSKFKVPSTVKKVYCAERENLTSLKSKSRPLETDGRKPGQVRHCHSALGQFSLECSIRKWLCSCSKLKVTLKLLVILQLLLHTSFHFSQFWF